MSGTTIYVVRVPAEGSPHRSFVTTNYEEYHAVRTASHGAGATVGVAQIKHAVGWQEFLQFAKEEGEL